MALFLSLQRYFLMKQVVQEKKSILLHQVILKGRQLIKQQILLMLIIYYVLNDKIGKPKFVKLDFLKTHLNQFYHFCVLVFEQMPIFNQTFTDDKPIYYPSTWGTGKTAIELYQQWKLTTQYFILSNIVQCALAMLWLFIIFVICSAIKQMIRLYRLDDTKRQKLENRKYISNNFIMSTTFIASAVIIVTIGLFIVDDFSKYALLKGLISWVAFLTFRKLYTIGKNYYIQQKSKRHKYQKLKKDEDSL